jgi:hypothetical protein
MRISSAPAREAPLNVQDGEGCPDTSGLDITNDGGAEINILDVVGYNLNSPLNTVSEPSAFLSFGAGIAIIGTLCYRRRTRLAS